MFEGAAADGGIDTVFSSVSFVLSAYVENLSLRGDAAIDGTGNELANNFIGNAAANMLVGGAGDDTISGGEGNDLLIGDSVDDPLIDGKDWLDGGAGADVMWGGDGRDTYVVDNTGDQIVDDDYYDVPLTNQVDTVLSSVSYTLGSRLELLTLTGTAAINGTGNALANTLTGNDEANVLDGQAGADTMVGGAGNDSYIVDNAGDTVTETSTLVTEIDTVKSAISFTLGANLENLELTGSQAIDGTGNALDNILIGNAADNVLDGGRGRDTMTGGAGNDTYIVDHQGDVVIEASTLATEVDTVRSSLFTYTLGANVENLILAETIGTNGTGNALDNTLTGNAVANVLDGGAGADTMMGGAGKDTYIVDNVGDVVIETLASTSSSQADTVNSSVSFTLGANVENLVLTGTAAINGTGNAQDNELTGNAADNVLDGGAGGDRMTGGAGNDTYIVDDIHDTVSESSSLTTEIDTVKSAVTFGLGKNVENLVLTGTAAVNGIGNVQANELTGNAAANQLDGAGGNDVLNGGAGSDRLTGGAGADVFVQTLGDSGVDTITDFSVGDALRFDGFTLLAAQNAGNLLLSVSAAGNVTTLAVSSASAPAEQATVKLLGNFAGQVFKVNGSVVTVAAIPPNVAPSGTDTALTLLEDTPRVLAAADFGFSDAADSTPGSLAAVIVTTTPASGLLTLAGNAVAAGQAVAAADIAAGLLVYTPAANASGVGLASFSFQVQDNGGTANGGINTDATPNTLRFDVQAVDDAAVLGSASLTLQETNAPLTVAGTLGISDVDSPASFVAQPGTAGKYGVFTIGADGAWTFKASLAYDYLNPGDSLKDSFQVTSSDGSTTRVAVTIAGTAETGTVHLGDAPVRQSGTGGQWAQAWTQAGYSIQHKADYTNSAEAWSKLTFSGVSSQLLSGGDISAGDLGVSGQSAATSTVKQEIDGKEALRIVVPGAAESVTIKLAGLFAHDDGGATNESGVLRLLDATGHVVAEQVFVADALDGSKTITLGAAGGFASMELLAGAYDAQGHFVYGATTSGSGQAVAVSTDALGKAHGSDFLLHAADFTVALVGVPGP